MSTSHSFTVKVACEVGERKAVILNNFAYWHLKNREDGFHIHDGFIWTYNSIAAFEKVWPYLSQKEIRTALDGLVTDGYLMTGNYNEWKIDRTKWYALTEKACSLLEIELEPKMHLTNLANAFDRTGKSNRPNGQMVLPSQANGIAPQGEPIPLVNTDINSNIEPNGSSALSLKEEKKEGKKVPSVVTKIRDEVISMIPGTSWKAKEGVHAKELSEKLRVYLESKNPHKAEGREATEDEVFDSFKRLVTASESLETFFHFRSITTFNANFNSLIGALEVQRKGQARQPAQTKTTTTNFKPIAKE